MKKQIALFAIFTTLSLFSFSQGTWTKKTDFAGMSRTGACGFSIGAKGYIGTGANAGNYLTDFWAYDTETDSWTQIADLSGPGRQYAVAFAIGERGYVGTGWSTGSNYMKTFWEYDPSTNTWTEKPSLPGTPRALAVAFTIGNNGYIGTGLNENPLSDFWKYDPSTESWTQIADYGGGKRKAAVAFVIGNRGFVGSGYCCGQGQNDFWEYNPVTDEWSEKADMPGALRIYACAFSIGLKGYVGTGNRAYHCCGDFGPALRDFWEFNSQTNTWKQIAPPNAGKRTRAIGITINGRGFFGLGYSTDYENDFHEYVPHDSQKTQEVLNDSTCFSDTPGQSFQTTTSRDGKVAESVFIGGLYVLASKEMETLTRKLGRADEAERYAGLRRQMEATLASAGWDGEWFRRAYDNDSQPVGSAECAEGQIFIEPQGMCVMAGVGATDGKAQKALDSVAARLASPHGIVLLTPAYRQYYLNLGEISSYPPGYKENGSVFCHTNPWVMIAETVIGRGDQAFDYYLRINPSAREELSDLHRCEPYVYAQMIAGTEAAKPGEAKNSWLTGTASWNYVAITQHILGIKATLDGLSVAPVIPADWPGFRAVRIYRGVKYAINVARQGPGNRVRLVVDGTPVEGTVIPLPPAGAELVKVEVTLE